MACNADLHDWDDWVIWEDYDINFVGPEYTGETLGAKSLLVVVYPKAWVDALPDHIHSFTVHTSTKLADNLPSALHDAFNKGESK